jgi:hypothetical protein
MYSVISYEIFSVQIYPSEFGLKRMKEEEVKGPLELVGDGSTAQDGKEEEDEEVHCAFTHLFSYLLLIYYYSI